MKSFAFVVFCFLCTFTQGAWATQGGEFENVQCNGVGNPNSPCDGTEVDVVYVYVPTPVPSEPVSCVVPQTAAETYLATDFSFNADPKLCAKQCKTVAKTCANVAKAQGKCFKARVKGGRQFTLANCASLTDVAARKLCLYGVKHRADYNLGVFTTNTVNAVEFCGDSVDACVTACGN